MCDYAYVRLAAHCCMAENNRPMYNVHPRLLHAHLGEKSACYTRSLTVITKQLLVI